MGDKIPVVNEKLAAFEGIYNMKETYLFIKDYMENSMFFDFTEKEYEEKNTPPSYKLVSNIILEKMLNDEYHIFIKCKMELSGNDVEVEINGVKKKMVKGVGKLTLNSYVEPQSDAKPEESPFTHFLNRVYEKFVGTDDLEKAMIQSALDVNEIVDRFKQHMNSMTK